MNSSRSPFLAVLTALSLSVMTAPVLAVPYASLVHNTTGSMYEFVLNEDADAITITRDGGNEIVINNPTAGRHAFDLETFTSFEIAVSKNASPGWTKISDPANLFTNVFRSTGLAINTDPSSPYFGTIYVGNPDTLPTASGRAMGDGISALSADLVGVDLANNFAVVTDPNDTSQWKAPGFTVGDSATASPWRIALDDANNLIVSDWSDLSGGIKYASPDLTSGGLVLKYEDGQRPLLEGDPVNRPNEEVHGSIASKVYATGSIGNGLVVYAMDEDYDIDHETLATAAEGNHVWKWNVGDVTEYDLPPELVINVGALPNAFLNLNIGVNAKIHYSPDHDKWYLTQYRSDGLQTGLVVVDADGPGADLADPNNPVALWDSMQFSLDNNFDGHFALNEMGEEVVAGQQDIFRHAGDVTISNDGQYLFLHRIAGTGAANPVLNNIGDGAVVIIPLDANGVPDIQIDDNGTPEDFTDDILTNVQTIQITNNLSFHQSAAVAELDAAGNLYIGNNVSELIEVFSPGGAWQAITTSDGTFMLQELTDGSLDGDYNDDGVVNAADYVVFRNNLDQAVTIPNDVTPGMVDASDYNVWVQNFGNTLPGAGSSAAVPEPAAAVMMLLGVAVALSPRRRQS